MTIDSRIPAGIPTGGQFAATQKSEASSDVLNTPATWTPFGRWTVVVEDRDEVEFRPQTTPGRVGYSVYSGAGFTDTIWLEATADEDGNPAVAFRSTYYGEEGVDEIMPLTDEEKPGAYSLDVNSPIIDGLCIDLQTEVDGTAFTPFFTPTRCGFVIDHENEVRQVASIVPSTGSDDGVVTGFSYFTDEPYNDDLGDACCHAAFFDAEDVEEPDAHVQEPESEMDVSW